MRARVVPLELAGGERRRFRATTIPLGGVRACCAADHLGFVERSGRSQRLLVVGHDRRVGRRVPLVRRMVSAMVQVAAAPLRDEGRADAQHAPGHHRQQDQRATHHRGQREGEMARGGSARFGRSSAVARPGGLLEEALPRTRTSSQPPEQSHEDEVRARGTGGALRLESTGQTTRTTHADHGQDRTRTHTPATTSGRSHAEKNPFARLSAVSPISTRAGRPGDDTGTRAREGRTTGHTCI